MVSQYVCVSNLVLYVYLWIYTYVDEVCSMLYSTSGLCTGCVLTVLIITYLLHGAESFLRS